MKNLIFLLALVAISYSIVFSQGCLPEGITFEYQEQIDSFQINYPGCTEIEGDVIIGILDVGSDIDNLNELDVLTTIGGNLNIYFTWLPNLSGLENLTSVGGVLEISYNEYLENLSGLENLSVVHGLVLHTNENLTNISALSSLDSILNPGRLFIINDHLLTTLEDIADIKLIEVPLIISLNSSLYDCDVQSICDYLADPNGYISIDENAPGCYNLSQVLAHCLTLMQECAINEEILIHPNPASSFITITTQQGQPIEETIIYNHLGQKVLVALPVNNTVDVSTLTPGIYYLEVITSESRAGTKLVVE
jgi:hypothetical protein